MHWDHAALVQRDLDGHLATCKPDPLIRSALATVQRPDRYARVLVLDAACICYNNGLGNQFGDFVMLFLMAAAANRTLFLDWTANARSGPPHKHNHSACHAERTGPICQHVTRRFDVSRWFGSQTPDGRVTSWRYSAAHRAQLERRHGAASEVRLRTSYSWAAHGVNCSELAGKLHDAAVPWLTIGIDDVSGGMMPGCTIGRFKDSAGWPGAAGGKRPSALSWRTAPPSPSWPIWRLGPLLRAPARRLGSL